jgi:hypothetical protein
VGGSEILLSIVRFRWTIPSRGTGAASAFWNRGDPVASHRESSNRRCCKQLANRTIDANPAGLQDPGNLYPPIGVRCIVGLRHQADALHAKIPKARY